MENTNKYQHLFYCFIIIFISLACIYMYTVFLKIIILFIDFGIIDPQWNEIERSNGNNVCSILLAIFIIVIWFVLTM